MIGIVIVSGVPNGGGGCGGFGKAVAAAGKPGYLNGLLVPYGIHQGAATVEIVVW
jgi:hypothetical protein